MESSKRWTWSSIFGEYDYKPVAASESDRRGPLLLSMRTADRCTSQNPLNTIFQAQKL